MKKIILFVIVSIVSISSYAASIKYQGGDAWTKYKISKEQFKEESLIIKDMILRTAKVLNLKSKEVGTSFLVKETLDSYIFITNYHVIRGRSECKKSKLLIKDSSFKSHVLKCHSIIQKGTIKSGSDYTYFSVKKNSKNSFLSQVKDIEIIREKPVPGTLLAVVGFAAGKFSTTKYDISVSQDDDCVYLMGNKSIRLSGELVKSTFFMGCDIAQGDSGAAIINRMSGELVGLFFASAIQSKKNPLTSDEIHQNLGTEYREFMTNAAYGIDARSIMLK